MRLWKPDTTSDDPPKDPEILKWFNALGPPPVGQPPQYLHAKVRARIAQKQTWPSVFSWLGRFERPVWAAALAAGLLLSLGVNLWWGLNDNKPSQLAASENIQPLSAYRFQVGLGPTDALQRAITARTDMGTQTVGRGFAPHVDAHVVFFRLGTLYADALAALHSAATDVATQRLTMLAEALAKIQAAPTLLHYLQEVHTLLQAQRYPAEELAKFLALFESLYVHEYTRGSAPEAVHLFQMGAWLENLALAVAVGSQTLPPQTQTLQTFQHALSRLNAPPAALEALAQLRPLVAGQTLTAPELHQVGSLLQTMQGILGAMTS